MELTEHIALYLRNCGHCAVSGPLPPAPDACAAVIATGLRPRGDPEGSRFQVLLRGESGCDTALARAMELIPLLEELGGAAPADDTGVLRIRLESGVAGLGMDEKKRSIYSMNFRAWLCPA